MLSAIPPSIKPENRIQELDTGFVPLEDTKSIAQTSSEEFNRNMHSPDYAGPSGLATLLHDELPLRKLSILANDVAESFKESLYNWFPSPIATLIYGGLWLASLASTAIRVLINYQHHHKPEEKLRAGTKLLIHESISAVAAPVVVANVTNYIQNKIYNLIKIPKRIKHLIRPLVSFITCYYSIDFLDPPAKQFSSWLTGIVDDHHKKVNDYMKAQKPESASALV